MDDGVSIEGSFPAPPTGSEKHVLVYKGVIGLGTDGQTPLDPVDGETAIAAARFEVGAPDPDSFWNLAWDPPIVHLGTPPGQVTSTLMPAGFAVSVHRPLVDWDDGTTTQYDGHQLYTGPARNARLHLEVDMVIGEGNLWVGLQVSVGQTIVMDAYNSLQWPGIYDHFFTIPASVNADIHVLVVQGGNDWINGNNMDWRGTFSIVP